MLLPEREVAAPGLNFYEQGVFLEVLQALALLFKVREDLAGEYALYAFPYSPPTMFLFLPLGLLDFETANALWLGDGSTAARFVTQYQSHRRLFKTVSDPPLLPSAQ
jgi:hypothetical protein